MKERDMTDIYPCVIETRLTYNHGGTTGMHCDYPFGLANNIMYKGQKAEVDRGQWPISIQLDFRDGWAVLFDLTGQPLTKFRQPETVEPDYREYRFWANNKLYILDFRFISMNDGAE